MEGNHFCSIDVWHGNAVLYSPNILKGASLVAQLVKNLPAMWKTWV